MYIVVLFSYSLCNCDVIDIVREEPRPQDAEDNGDGPLLPPIILPEQREEPEDPPQAPQFVPHTRSKFAGV